MIEARLALPGQSTPGPDACRACRQRERKRIIGQRGAPPYEGDLRLQRSIGREPTDIRSIWVLSPPRRHPGASRPGAQPRQRRPSDSLHQVQRSCRIRHICQCQACTPLPIQPGTHTELPDLEPCRGRAPTRSRRSYRISRDGRDQRLSPYVTAPPESERPSLPILCGLWTRAHDRRRRPDQDVRCGRRLARQGG